MSTHDIARDHVAREDAARDEARLFAGRNAIYAAALAGGVTLHAVNIYLVTTILPSVVRDIGGLDYYAWSTTLFIVASILGAALSTQLLRRAGPRGAYAAAAVIFALGTLLCALAPSMPVLLGGRFVQGIGGGFLYALAYTVTRLVFPEALWARAIGLISAMWGIATLVGPAVGGVFAEYFAWRAAFWCLVPLIALFALLAFATLPRRVAAARDNGALPLAQIALLAGAVLAVSAGSIGRDVAWNLLGLGVALVLVGLLVLVERRASARLLPQSALRATPLAALYGVIALLVIGMQPELFVPYFLQVLHGQSPLVSGYLAALMAIGWTLGSMLSATWTSRVMRAGPALVLGGLAALAAFLPAGGAGWVLAPISLGLLLVGFGIGVAWPHLMTQVFKAAPAAEQDKATAGATTVQFFATAFGAATAGMVANLAGLTTSAGVAPAAFWLFALFALAPVLCIPLVLRVTRRTVPSSQS
jgi:MFS family permease